MTTTDTDPRLLDAVRAEAGDEKRLPCARAFAIAEELGLTPAHVGRACDELGVKIFGCQLGCF
jgi:hypothetical protein